MTATSDLARARRAFAYENPRPEIQRHVPHEARRVLDLGCSSGALGAALKARQDVTVVGIELDPMYAERARDRLDRVVVADLDRPAGDLPDGDDLGRFDCLIAGDVLEHLRDPWACLAWATSLLDPGGVAVVSLPNIRYWDTFWQLGVKGRWPLRGEGIFDRTHLRWFTALNAIELLEGADLDVVAIDRLYRFGPRGTRWDRYATLLGRTPLRPFFAFQLVLVGRRSGG